MKSLFSFTIFFLFAVPSNLYAAREIVLIEYSGDKKSIEIVRKVLREQFDFPESFITHRKIKGACTLNNQTIIHLCVQKNDEVQIVFTNEYVLKNMLGEFTKAKYESKGESNE